MTQHLLDELPKDTRVYLENILAKDPAWLTEHDIAFLNARRDYLTDEQKRVFADVLVSDEEAEQPEAPKSKSQAKREKAQADQSEA